MAFKEFYITLSILICLLLMVTPVTTDCDNEITFYLNNVSPSISVRLFFDKTWECYLTDFYDERTIDFGQKLLLVLREIHNTVSWFEDVKIQAFRSAGQALVVDYKVKTYKEVTLEQYLVTATQHLFPNIFKLSTSVTLDGDLLKLKMPPALVIKNAAGYNVLVPVNAIRENPCELLDAMQICRNGAECRVYYGAPKCDCAPGFTGELCYPEKQVTARMWLTILIVVLVLMSVCISVFIVLSCCRRSTERKLLYRATCMPVSQEVMNPSTCANTSGREVALVPPPAPQPAPHPQPQITEVPYNVTPYKGPRTLLDGMAVATGGIPLPPPMRPVTLPQPPPVLLPLSAVPSARVASQPQRFLQHYRRFKIFKDAGGFIWNKRCDPVL